MSTRRIKAKNKINKKNLKRKKKEKRFSVYDQNFTRAPSGFIRAADLPHKNQKLSLKYNTKKNEKRKSESFASCRSPFSLPDQIYLIDNGVFDVTVS